MKVLLATCFLLFTLASCTVASLTVEDENGKKVTAAYTDFHIGGNAVAAQVEWEGVGKLVIDRTTEDSQKAVEALTQAVTKMVIPSPLDK